MYSIIEIDEVEGVTIVPKKAAKTKRPKQTVSLQLALKMTVYEDLEVHSFIFIYIETRTFMR